MTRKLGFAWMLSTAFIAATACGGDESSSVGSGGTGATDGGAGAAGAAGSTAGSAGAGGSAGTGGTAQCGNSVVEGTEDCDDGNTDDTDGCTATCDFTCAGDNACDDGDTCNGPETCVLTTHMCSPGTPPADGTSCGTNGETCQGGTCLLPSCGDGVTDSGEECDDANTTSGDGCDGCQFTCVSTDTARDCSGASNECVLASTCDDTTHTCQGGTNVTDGTGCNSGAGTCEGGVCVATVCGDSAVEGSEQCDDGNADDTDGCKADCTFTCAQDADCSDANTCTSDTCDTTAHTCSNPADTAQNGSTCTPASGGTGTCGNGLCVPASCGNGTLEGAEQCDDQNADDTDGCKSDCTFTCAQDADCSDANACNGSEACDTTAHTCSAGTNAAQGTACGTALMCNGGGACVASTCGDGFTDTRTEACDDANSDDTDGCKTNCTFTCAADGDCADSNVCNGAETCNTTAHTCVAGTNAAQGTDCGTGQICSASGACVASTCGDGVTDARTEACDDANSDDTDGCKTDCTFTCAQASDCADGNSCTTDACNTTAHTCTNAADASQNGLACTDGSVTGICAGAVCSPASCGNSAVESGEECDRGSANGTAGSGCTSGCQFECDTAGDCNDSNACTGTESCATITGGRTCQAGTALPTGSACGTGLICNASSACVTSTCGDGLTDSRTEACDDANANDADGCKADCTYSCTQAADCADANACNGSEGCNTTTHMCTAGTNASQGTVCGGASICNGTGSCVASTCGDAYTDTRTEACDDANGNDADGCKADCTFTCTQASDCGDANVCTQDLCNTTAHTCSNPADTAQNGNACTTSGGQAGSCNAGVCAAFVCGNSVVESGEECDRGSATNGTAGSGCTAGCQFQCDTSTDCVDANTCNGAETCGAVTGGRTCSPGTNASQGTACGTNQICNGTGACVNSVCGDGYVDAGRSETCEPPNTATCSATCTTIAAAVCGNGVIEGTEQCDDGATLNLDGCDSVCKYEPVYRITHAGIITGNRPAFCNSTGNRLGSALTNTALGQLNPPLQDAFETASTNIMVQALGLDDLTGVADPSLTLGVMTGTLDPSHNPAAWPGTAAGNGPQPIDWWFLADAAGIDANGLPTGILSPGSIAARQLNAGPGTVTMTLVLAGVPSAMVMRNTKIRANIDGTPAPNVPAPPPGTLASGLTVAQTISGGCDGTVAGSGAANCTTNTLGLCGDITVASLAQIPIPEALTTGTGDCTQNYTYCGAGLPKTASCSSLLDALVGGCTVSVFGFPITAINASQPDVAGADGDVDNLTLPGSGVRTIAAAQTNNNTDAYSSLLRFKANRAHLTNNLP